MHTILPVVLHVEDDPNDRLFLREALQTAGLSVRLETAADGQVALDYLRGAGPFQDRTQYPIPVLVLLDLKLPRVTGLEVLTWIRTQPQFQSLPVVIFTSSQNESDMRKAYAKGANSYLLKPVSFDGLVSAVKDIHHYWFDLNQTLPAD